MSEAQEGSGIWCWKIDILDIECVSCMIPVVLTFVRLFARGSSAQQGRHAVRIKDAQTDGCQIKKDHCVAYSLRQHFEVWLAN